MWQNVMDTIKQSNFYVKLTLKIRGKPKTVFGRLKIIKDNIYLLDKANKLCYGPGTKVLSID